MRLLVFLMLGLMTGCAHWEAEQHAWDVADCTRRLDAAWTPAVRQQFLSACIAIQPGGLAENMVVPMGSPYGRPDAFGPYGYRGPTWEQFNDQFGAPSSRTVIPPPR